MILRSTFQPPREVRNQMEHTVLLVFLTALVVVGYGWWIYEDVVRRPRMAFTVGRLTSGCPNGCRHGHARGEKCPRRPH